MQTLTFTHHLVCEPQELETAAQAVLHTICFHRFLGTVKPAYVELLGTTFPAIADRKTDEMVRQRSAEVVDACTANQAATLVAMFLQPSSKLAPKNSDMTQASTPPLDKPTSSLRTWTSTRAYQYGWLAQAFSSGAGQPTGTFISSATPDDDAEADAFERWKITFELTQGGGGDVKRELAVFVEEALRFVEHNKAHLPAITSADLCTFPTKVVVRSG